jgi:hypothetical protein
MKKQLLLFTFVFSSAICFAQIPNAGFENWNTTISDTVPENWSSSGFGAGRSPVAHSGNYSAYVWNWYSYAKGWIVNGDVPIFAFSQANTYVGGTPINEKPTALHGYYFYVPDNNGASADSAFVNVTVKKYNNTLQQPDTVALGRLHLGPASSFIPFTVDIEDLAPGIDPDSIVISFWSCFDNQCFCDAGGDGNCLFFYVDDISLDLPSGIVSIDDWFGKLSIYPNVISENAIVQVPRADAKTVDLLLFNSLGSVVRTTTEFPGSKISFNREGLSPGIYFMKAEAGGRNLGVKKVIIQ